MTKLDGKVGIISGGLGDIGRSIAVAMAREGADVALGDIRQKDSAREVLTELTRLGRRCRYDEADVSDANSVREWFRIVGVNSGIRT